MKYCRKKVVLKTENEIAGKVTERLLEQFERVAEKVGHWQCSEK